MITTIVVCILAGLGAGLGTGFAGMSAAAVISPMLITFLGMDPYQAIGIALASDVLASAVSAYEYGKNKNLDIYPLTVIVCDCNGLKRINDHYGHLVGDRYIIKTAEALMTCKPENASVIRAGGDEFMVFMPNTSEAEAAQYMEKVQDYISNIHIFDETLSIAMGSSTTTDISKRLEDLISLADKAMYIQKEIDHKRLGIPSR